MNFWFWAWLLSSSQPDTRRLTPRECAITAAVLVSVLLAVWFCVHNWHNIDPTVCQHGGMRMPIDDLFDQLAGCP